METLTGTLTDIRFNKNGFVIARIHTPAPNPRVWGIKGTMPAPQVGMEYTLTGRWERHPRFGRTFVFSDYRSAYPKDLGAIRAYLEENCKWIGPEISKKIVNEFGADALRICKDDPDCVAAKIPGVTSPRAGEIAAMLRDNEANEELQIALKALFDGVRISRRAVNNVIAKYGHEAVEKTKTNPYALIDDIDGVGFLTADQVAQKLGHAPDSPFRVHAGIVHVLQDAAFGDGHTCLPQDILQAKTTQLLDVEPHIVTRGISDMLNAGRLRRTGTGYALPELCEAEETVAKILKGLSP